MTGCPETAIAENWPLVLAKLRAHGLASKNSQAAMIATIAIETASRFRPIEEMYNDPPGKYAYFEGMYGVGHHPSAVSMGNTSPGDGAKYYGRGFIQITWKGNYVWYGGRIGADLLNSPELALDPANAAEIAVLYWADRGIAGMADSFDWTAVRRAVQGGTNGLDRLVSICNALLY